MQMLLAKTNMQSKLKFIRLVLRFWAKTRPQSKQYPLFGKHPFVRINAHVIGQFKHAIKTRVKFKSLKMSCNKNTQVKKHCL